jgi:hypothetical protein
MFLHCCAGCAQEALQDGDAEEVEDPARPGRKLYCWKEFENSEWTALRKVLENENATGTLCDAIDLDFGFERASAKPLTLGPLALADAPRGVPTAATAATAACGPSAGSAAGGATAATAGSAGTAGSAANASTLGALAPEAGEAEAAAAATGGEGDAAGATAQQGWAISITWEPPPAGEASAAEAPAPTAPAAPRVAPATAALAPAAQTALRLGAARASSCGRTVASTPRSARPSPSAGNRSWHGGSFRTNTRVLI